MKSLFKNECTDFCKMSGGSVTTYLISIKTQILISHKMRMLESTVNNFIVDKSSEVVVSGLLVNIP